jgi:thioredoxin-related protein
MSLAVRIPLFLMLVMLACGSGSEQASTPPAPGQQISLKDAQVLAKETGKHIVLDVFTTWCGYCRQMDTKTYPDAAVQAVIGESFIRVRLNAESKSKVVFNGRTYTEEDLAKSMGVTSYPSTIFVTPEGKTIGYQPGYMDAPLFARLLRFVASGSYQTTSFETFEDKF